MTDQTRRACCTDGEAVPRYDLGCCCRIDHRPPPLAVVVQRTRVTEVTTLLGLSLAACHNAWVADRRGLPGLALSLPRFKYSTRPTRGRALRRVVGLESDPGPRPD